MIYVSKNDGKAWVKKNIDNLPSFDDYNTFAGSDAICTNDICAIATSGSLGFALIISRDHGDTWNYQDITPPDIKTNYYLLNKVYCNKNNCFVAGGYSVYSTSKEVPFLATSHDFGKTWSSQKTLHEDMESGTFLPRIFD